MSTELLAGRTYAIQCINRDSETAPPHRQLGMFKALNVRSAAAAPRTTALHTDTIVGNDYAYTKVPPALTAGVHHFVFVNAGKQRHEINVALLKPGVTLKQVIDLVSSGGNPDTLVEEPLGVLHAASNTGALRMLDFTVLT